jgi:hypothetical protein
VDPKALITFEAGAHCRIIDVYFTENWRFEDRSDGNDNYPQIIYVNNLLGALFVETLFINLMTISGAEIEVEDDFINICDALVPDIDECYDLEEYSVT